MKRGELGDDQMIDAFVAQDWLRVTKGTWRQNPKLSGGGLLYDSGVHALNTMMWLVDSSVQRVYAILGNDTLRCPGRAGIMLDDVMHVLYESTETGSPVDVTQVG